MSAPAPPSSDGIDATVFDAAGPGLPFGAAPAASAPSHGISGAVDAFEGDETEENPRQGVAAVEQPTPTEIDPAAPCPPAAAIQVISMKDHTSRQRPKPEPRVPLHVQLRALAEVSGARELQRGLGYLAPPRDPVSTPERSVRDVAVRLIITVALAVAAALVIWLLAG
jgi:hypothetical protein